ncbi:hypothetical protein BNJ_00061 [Kaumoebavirus]|nr:hypothetical protein BNJ_00061 [Kaumoebavirus]ARA71903.1 hypothetical protein BNJ_00061 [Kaumoebavirus]
MDVPHLYKLLHEQFANNPNEFWTEYMVHRAFNMVRNPIPLFEITFDGRR